MKKIILGFISIFTLSFMLTGCTGTISTDDKGNIKKEFNISETATVNKTKIKINSVKKVKSECMSEYDNECLLKTEPENDYFLVIDLTIENTDSEELSVSSIMSFNLKDTNGEQGKYTFLSKNVTSQLDGSVMANDLLKGQIAYDVKDSDKFYFYYIDSLLDDQIKFIINKSDIQ